MCLYKSEFIPDFIFKKIEMAFALLKLTYRSPAFYRFHKVFLPPCLRLKKQIPHLHKHNQILPPGFNANTFSPFSPHSKYYHYSN